MRFKLWKLRHRLSGEAGEVYVEYTVLAAVAVLVILFAIQYFFGGIAQVFQRMGDVLRGIG